MTRSPKPSSSDSKQSPPGMTARSRTGKIIQDLFGRFKKTSPQAVPTTPDFLTRSVSNIEPDDLPKTNILNDNEDSNWDEEEGPDLDKPPTPQPKPIATPTTPITSTTSVDTQEDWDEALPAQSVKNESSVMAKRGQNDGKSKTEDWWESIPATNPVPIPPNTPTPKPQTPSENPFDRAIGLWTAILQQLRRLLPLPLQKLSDAILTAFVVVFITLGIWIVDNIFIPSPSPQTPKIVATQPPPPTAPTSVQISPEQGFIQAIEGQIAEITYQYPDDIIQTLQVDLAQNRLIVRLNNVWYLISDGKQNEVSDRMWSEALANHFTKLEIQGPQGELIARSPVVGQHAIIVQRRVKI